MDLTRTLSEKALLVNLSISNWGGTRIDRTLTNEVETSHDVKNAGRYQKYLVTSEELKEIRQSTLAVRDHHRKNTLVWDDNGGRLLPTANYFEYMKKASGLKEKYEAAVLQFIEDYPKIIDNAQERLNSIFNAKDYPAVSELWDRFAIKLELLPAPASTFSVNLDEASLSTLNTHASAVLSQKLDAAQKDAWSRVSDVLVRAKNALSDNEVVSQSKSGELHTRQRPIHTSLFEDINELIQLIPRLNIKEDPLLDELCTNLTVLNINPVDLRKDKALKESTATEVDRLISKFKNYL